MNFANCFQFIVLAAFAGFGARAAHVRQARSLGVFAAALCSIASGLFLVFQSLTSGDRDPSWLLPYPLLVALITLAATAMSALANTSRRTYATILALGALSTALVLVDSGPLFLLLWILSPLLVWLELARADRGTARLFLVNLSLATLLLVGALATPEAGTLALGAMILGLAVREACFPFHSWLLSFVEKAPMGVVVAFLAPQPGVYLHLRALHGHLPPEFHQEAAILGALTALFAAALATAQTRLKRTLAYLIMSQSGLVAFGMEASSEVALTGALSAWLLVGLGMAGFAMSVEALESRRAVELETDEPGGDFEATPVLATSFLLSGLAMVGLPGTLGFVVEDLLVQGSVAEFPFLGLILVVVTALNAITVMRCLLTVFVGQENVVEIDLAPRERLAMSLVLAALFGLGLCPQLLVTWFAH